MTTQQYLTSIVLEDYAKQLSNQPETKDIAGVLNALCAAILLDDTQALLKYCADYSTEKKNEILKIMPVGAIPAEPQCNITRI